jgi:hypothetical protein
MLSTPTGLAEWFADKVDERNGHFSFHWDGSDQSAELVSFKENEWVKFQWDDEDDEDLYFEFRIVVDAITNDVALIVTDFCEEDEEAETRLLWEHQINDLKHSIGA